ncbi:helix-turn-helix domain-containing protein [Halapricum desulfuricans]
MDREIPTRRWAHTWNDGRVDGLRPRFGGGRPPKLSRAEFDELCMILENGLPWTPCAIHALIEDHYGVTYHLAHLSRKLQEAGMNYAKPRPLDPCRPADADEILAERLGQALGEDESDDEDSKEDEPVVLGVFR